MSNHYQILGVSRSVSADSLKTAYRKKLKQYHPDLAEDKQAAHEMTQQVIAAYEVLSDPGKRAAYDAHLQKHDHAVIPAQPQTAPRHRPTAPIGIDLSLKGWLAKAIILFLVLNLCAALLLAIGQSHL